MAIEKALPNVPIAEALEVEIEDTTEVLPEGIIIEGEEEQDTILEIVPDDPANFYDNLAEVIDENELRRLALDLVSDFEEDEVSREEWMKVFSDGLDLLGINTEERSEPVEGASGVGHPLLSESVAQCQAQAYRALLPAEGPVQVQIIGDETTDKVKQAQRVQDFMNYEITYAMEEYDPEFDQMLFYLPLSGSAFKKVYYDERLG